MIKIAIDPGSTGGIVWGTNMTDVQAISMPATIGDIWAAIADIRAGADTVALMEKVGTYMPGNSGPSAATFAEHVGCLKMALIAAAIPHEVVTPQSWMKSFITLPAYESFVQGTGESDKEFAERKRKTLTVRKKERKDLIKAKAQMIFPSVKVTLLNADALGVYWYGLQKLALWRG